MPALHLFAFGPSGSPLNLNDGTNYLTEATPFTHSPRYDQVVFDLKSGDFVVARDILTGHEYQYQVTCLGGSGHSYTVARANYAALEAMCAAAADYWDGIGSLVQWNEAFGDESTARVYPVGAAHVAETAESLLFIASGKIVTSLHVWRKKAS
jgi:hypothetical protein